MPQFPFPTVGKGLGNGVYQGSEHIFKEMGSIKAGVRSKKFIWLSLKTREIKIIMFFNNPK